MQPFNTSSNAVSESRYYTLSDHQDFSDDNGYPRTYIENTNTFAKAVKNRPSKHITSSQNFYSFYIRTDPNNNILNPTKKYTIEPVVKKNFINRVCKSDIMFTQVSPQVFDYYINFLKTQSTQWLTLAQRSLK